MQSPTTMSRSREVHLWRTSGPRQRRRGGHLCPPIGYTFQGHTRLTSVHCHQKCREDKEWGYAGIDQPSGAQSSLPDGASFRPITAVSYDALVRTSCNPRGTAPPPRCGVAELAKSVSGRPKTLDVLHIRRQIERARTNYLRGGWQSSISVTHSPTSRTALDDLRYRRR